MIALEASGIAKSFVLHLQRGVRLGVLRDAGLTLRAGECVALTGPSGAGKSTLLRALYGNYRADAGSIRVRHRGAMVELAGAAAERVIEIRRETIGHVSQFLRAMPRVPARDVVAAPLLERGMDEAPARARAVAMLDALGIPKALHTLPPVTFSGGEQQRVNLARGFAGDWPILLLDEPTASLDAANRDRVIALMRAARSRGAALLGIFHDPLVRDAIADAELRLEPLKEPA